MSQRILKPDPGGIYALTFDCYGTLIDWQGGVTAACARTPILQGCDLAQLVRDRELVEREIQSGPYRRYDEVLEESLVLAALKQGRGVSAAEARAFVETMPAWPPFEESRAVLKRLAARYQLAILSNVETRVLEASVRALGAPIEDLITAEMLSSYKPKHAHFHAALARLGLEKERILHVACSLYHDVRPALELGWFTAWVNREREPLPPDLRPAWVVPDLSTLARELGC
jgi:2-haloalkanoic acid dehalogenase type II